MAEPQAPAVPALPPINLSPGDLFARVGNLQVSLSVREEQLAQALSLNAELEGRVADLVSRVAKLSGPREVPGKSDPAP